MWKSLRKRDRDAIILDAVSLSLFGGEIPERRSESDENVMTIVRELPERERRIVMRRFGLDGDKRISTLDELASSMGVSRERVRKIQKRALEELRERLAFTA
jgi:RNA polymerase nonessential primary-like sigma factor